GPSRCAGSRSSRSGSPRPEGWPVCSLPKDGAGDYPRLRRGLSTEGTRALGRLGRGPVRQDDAGHHQGHAERQPGRDALAQDDGRDGQAPDGNQVAEKRGPSRAEATQGVIPAVEAAGAANQPEVDDDQPASRRKPTHGGQVGPEGARNEKWQQAKRGEQAEVGADL